MHQGFDPVPGPHPDGGSCSCRWPLGPGVTWEDLWPHKEWVSGSEPPDRSQGEDMPSVNLPLVALGDLCPLPLSLGVTRTSSGRLRKLGDPTGPGKWLVQPWPTWFLWGQELLLMGSEETLPTMTRPGSRGGDGGGGRRQSSICSVFSSEASALCQPDWAEGMQEKITVVKNIRC